MAKLKARRAAVYLSTGSFFVVALTGQLHGETVVDTFVKAAIACVVIAGVSVILADIIGTALSNVPAPAEVGAGDPRQTAQQASGAGAPVPASAERAVDR